MSDNDLASQRNRVELKRLQGKIEKISIKIYGLEIAHALMVKSNITVDYIKNLSNSKIDGANLDRLKINFEKKQQQIDHNRTQIQKLQDQRGNLLDVLSHIESAGSIH